MTNDYLKKDDRRLPTQEEYIWMTCFGAHTAPLFVALDELLPYVPAGNHDFTPSFARARSHAEAIDKAFHFRLAFLHRLNEINRVHGDHGVLDVLRAQHFQPTAEHLGSAVFGDPMSDYELSFEETVANSVQVSATARMHATLARRGHGRGRKREGARGRGRKASKRVAEGDADYDRKGKRPAQPAAVEAPSRTIHAPEDGWLDKDGKVHRRHTADARILQRDLDDVFQIYDLLAPAEEPLRDLVEDGTDLPASSPASSAELFKTITAALALCTTVALRINKRGKKLHVEHEYGAEVAKEFDAVDPLGGKGSADYKELKKAIEKVKAKKPSSSSSREKPSSSSREPESFHRGSDDRREGGRREEKSPSGRSSAADITCYRCQRKGHFSRDCPSARR
eukprot:jgi/Tetstr1/450246/TSEL_037284.t1